MATITISNAGGNFNSTATWVGGVIPVAADTINATATSGSLIINVASSIRVLDLTNYVSTLELRQDFLVGNNTGNGTTLVLGSGMTITAPLGSIGQLGVFAGRGGTGVGNSIRTNGVSIPFFYINVNQNQSLIQLLDNLTCNTFTQYAGNGNIVINGFQMNITNWITSIAAGGSGGRFNGSTIINLNGANCSWNYSNTGLISPVGMRIIIDTPGTLTITNWMMVAPYNSIASNTGIIYIQGTIVGDKVLRILPPSLAAPGGNTTYTMDLNGSGVWNIITIGQSGTNTSTFSLSSNLNFNKLYVLNDNLFFPNTPLRFPVRFTGVGALKGGSFYTNTTQNASIPFSANTSNSVSIELNTGVSHSIGYLSSIGGDETSFNRVLFRSISGGTQANLSLTGNTQGVFYTNFTDINASGGNTIYTYSGTTSNTQNILPISSYVPTSSNTFLNG